MIADVFIISATTSLVIALLLILSPIINKRYGAFWRYLIWGILALRLIIPFRVEFSFAPVHIPEYREVEQVSELPVSTDAEDISIEEIAKDNAQPSETAVKPGEIGGIPIAEESVVRRPISAGKIVALIWAAGAVLFFLFHTSVYLLFRLRIRRSLVKEDDGVYRSGRIRGPITVGFIKPVIILPEIEYSAEERGAIIRHEKTHCRRGDMWYKLLLLLANSMHWFNPLVYIMAKYANRDLEYSCDDRVIRGEDMEYRKNYSRAILRTIGDRENGE